VGETNYRLLVEIRVELAPSGGLADEFAETLVFLGDPTPETLSYLRVTAGCYYGFQEKAMSIV
jgi:hypothetical protein